MTYKTTTLRDAISFALAMGAAAGSATAFAQDTAASQDTKATTLDRIEVTGTRIRQVDLETAAPVLQITRKDIEKQGFQTVGDILQNVASTGAPPISRAAPLSSGENVGGTYISLRNLGAQRTLVLLNGKRLGVSTSGLADVSVIPAVAVERIEVLKDGASSVYGSDAIAGVINVITRTNFEGATAGVYYGQYSQGDGSVSEGDFAMGFTGERGSLTGAAEWGKEEGVDATDRDFSAFPRSSLHPTDGWTTVGQYGGFVTTSATQVPGVASGRRVVLRSGGNFRNPADYRAQDTNTGGCTVALQGCAPGSIADKSNTLEQTGLRTPLERKSLYLDGVYDITDNVRFRTNLLYSERSMDRFIAGYPLQATSPSSGGAATLAANSYFNPLGTPINNWWRRTWEVPRVSNSELTSYRFSGAFEGSFDLADRTFDWDVSYLNNDNKLVQTGFGDINIQRLRQSVGPSFLNAQGQVQCGTAAAPISFTDCVPFNPFLPAGATGPGGLTNNRQLQDYLFQELHNTGETETTVMAANLAGTIMTLPAGDLAFAIGVENRKEQGKFSPDAMAVTGNSTTLAAGPTHGQYSVDEVYAELQVPILADLPFARELTLSLASRFSDYDTFGQTTNNKFGLKWKPFDSLLLRATYADGFRAPTIADLYGGGSQTFAFFTDPCDTNFGDSKNNPGTRANCVAAMGPLANTYRQLGQGLVPVNTPNSQTPVAFMSGSNPTLTPELSKSQTIGAVWSPSFAEGLNMSIDWWKIRIDDTIVSDSPNQILTDCYINNIASRCSPQLFTRDPALGYINFMSFGSRNAGFRKVEGYDVDVSYRLKTENFGDFSIVSNSTYTAKDYLVSTDDPRIALSSVSSAGTFRIRSNLNLGWQRGSWGINWIARYYSAMKESCTYFNPAVNEPSLECNEVLYTPTGNITGVTSSLTRRRRTGSNTFNDIQVRWQAPWNATIAIGANNVFEHYGPVMYTQPSSNVSYYGGFDIGRFIYLKYQQRF